MWFFITCFLLFTLTSIPVSALPYNHCRRSTIITTTDARFNVGTFTAHGSEYTPTIPLQHELLFSFPTPPAVDRHHCHDPGYVGYPIGPTRAQPTTVKAGATVLSLGGLVKRTAPLPEPTVALMDSSSWWRGPRPSAGPLPRKQIVEELFGEVQSVESGSGNRKAGLMQHSLDRGLYGARWWEGRGRGEGKLALESSSTGVPVSKRSPSAESQPQGDTDKTTPEFTIDLNDATSGDQASAKVESKDSASPDFDFLDGVVARPIPTTSPLPIWTPDVIATSLALIPVILAITIVCCLLLFTILHCCSPREITHVTNNTYTTKIVKRTPRDTEKPRPTTEGPSGNDNGQGITPPQPAVVAPSDAQADGNLDQRTEPSPSSDLYIPHYPRQYSVISVNSGESAEKRWHRGLLDLGRRKNLSRQTSFLHPFVPSSLLTSSDSNVDTSYILNQASKRLETVPPRPLSTVPASPLPSSPSPASSSPMKPPLTSPEQRKAKTTLATGLQDTGCSSETLRNRRKGMRDNWLSSLFVEKAPGTENLVILEQRDGAIRGASVGGAREPETLQVTECSSTPVKVTINVQDKELRRHGSEIRRSDNTTAKGNHIQTKANNRGAQKTRNFGLRFGSVPQRLGEMNSKSVTVRSVGPMIYEVQSPVSGGGYQGSQSDLGYSDTSLPDEIPKSNMGKENVIIEHARSRRTSEDTYVSRIDATLRVPVNHAEEMMTIENNFLIPPPAFDGLVDSTPFNQLTNFEEEFARQLKEAVRQEVEDELQLQLVESLDGSANSPDGLGQVGMGLGWSERSATDCGESEVDIADRFESKLFCSSSKGTTEMGDVLISEQRGSTTSFGVSLSID